MPVTNAQVEVDNAKLIRPFREMGKQRWIHHMNTCKSKSAILPCIQVGVWTLYLTRLYISPANQSHVIIEEQIPTGLTLRHQQCSCFPMGKELKGAQVGITENIHIMDKETLRSILQQVSRMFNASASFQKCRTFIAKPNVHTHRMLVHPLLNHVGKMMHIDNHITNTRILQLLQCMFQ